MSFNNKINNFWKKYQLAIILCVWAFVVSLIIKINLITVETNDYRSFLSKWMTIIRENGGIRAIKENIGDYNTPYLIIMAILSYLPINDLIGIKIISIVFDYVLSTAVFFIILELFKKDEKKYLYASTGFLLTTLLPTVLLNSGAWGQCDSIYTTFVLLSILFLLKEKHIRAFIFLGIAFSFKLQAIFILPLFILVYLSKKNYSLLYFLIIPITILIMCLPAIILGKSVVHCFSVYLTQTSEYSKYISMNFPSIYNIFMNAGNNPNVLNNIQGLGIIGIGLTLLGFIIAADFIIRKNIILSNKSIIKIALLSIMFSTFMLPYMHDRYLYMADIISIVYFLIEKKGFFITIGINCLSLNNYICYLWLRLLCPFNIAGVIFAELVIILAIDTVKEIKKDNIVSIDKKCSES